MIVNHPNGSPDDCSEQCSTINQHPDDAPPDFVCSKCGGRGACYPDHIETYQPWEPWEGIQHP